MFVKLIVFAPVKSADKIRKVLAVAGCGKLGDYDSCSFSSIGWGRFRPLKGSQPVIGRQGKIERVREERIEVLAPRSKVKSIIKLMTAAHPYEEPAFDIVPVLNTKNFRKL